MGLTVHFIKRRSIFMGRSQNAGFLFFTWIYNLPYHDQSQIIDENKYTGLTVHFIRIRSIFMGVFAKCGIFQSSCETFAKCVVFIIVVIDFKKQESCCLGYYFTYIKSIRLSYVFESVSTALFLGQSQKHHSQNDEQYAHHTVHCDFLT